MHVILIVIVPKIAPYNRYDEVTMYLATSQLIPDMIVILRSDCTYQQVCIPVGCVPPACWPFGVGGGFCPTPVNRVTHRCQNITLRKLRLRAVIGQEIPDLVVVMESDCTYWSVRSWTWPLHWGLTVPADRCVGVWLYFIMESYCTYRSVRRSWTWPLHWGLTVPADHCVRVWLYFIMESYCTYRSVRRSWTWPLHWGLTVPADRCVGVWLYLPMREVIPDMTARLRTTRHGYMDDGFTAAKTHLKRRSWVWNSFCCWGSVRSWRQRHRHFMSSA